MARALTPNQTFEHVLAEDRDLKPDDPDRTVWILRTLSAGEEAEIQDSAAAVESDGAAISVRTGSITLETLRRGLVGVRNFRDEKGAQVVPSFTVNGRKRVVDDTFISAIRPEHRRELANAISAGGRVTEDDAGKSSPPST